MTFWIIAIATVAIISFFFYRSLAITAPADHDQTDLRVFKDQLAEVDRDLARGIINIEDADRLKTQIGRKILAADKSKTSMGTNLSKRAQIMIGGLTAIFAIAGSLGLYSLLGHPTYGDIALKDRIANANKSMNERPTQQDFWDKMPAEMPLNTPEGDYGTMVAKLRETVATRPNDLEGQTLLARIESGLQNYRAASVAQERILSIKGDQITPDDYFDYAEYLILSSNGYISPEAQVALQATLTRDPKHGGALYYSGIMMAQNDRADVAFRIWAGLLNDAKGDEPWVEPVRQMIPEIAVRAGINDYVVPGTGLKGPTADDVAAAGEMTAGDRMGMIKGMVSQLSERLFSEGGSVAEWARLINAYKVLEDPDQAKLAYEKALAAFAGDTAALDQINAAATQAGIK